MAGALSPEYRTPQAPRPLLIELAGLAGAGKSTLSGTLLRRLNGAAGTIWGLPVLSLLANGVQLIPTFSGLWLHSQSLLWSETRHMVRLQTLYRALRRRQGQSNEVLIFDEGPVFAMAWLRGFGHETLREQPSAEWWGTTLRDWGSVIDVVVVLDAPDALLAQRIRGRPQDHEVKGLPDDEIARWMARFRDALEWVLAEMTRHGGPVVVRLSAEEQPRRLAENLLEELSGSAHVR